MSILNKSGVSLLSEITLLASLLKRRRISESGCWIWTGAIQSNSAKGGYGLVSYKGKAYKIHRLAWSLANGRSPAKGKMICHKCDVRACFNPDHLYEGTQKSNIQDRVIRNRSFRPIGDINVKSKISESDVVAAFDLRKGGLTNAEIARRMNLSKTQIGKILNRKSWTHVLIDETQVACERVKANYSDFKNHNKNKTHCKRGHEFSKENTIVIKKGNGLGRLCRACRSKALHTI